MSFTENHEKLLMTLGVISERYLSREKFCTGQELRDQLLDDLKAVEAERAEPTEATAKKDWSETDPPFMCMRCVTIWASSQMTDHCGGYLCPECVSKPKTTATKRMNIHVSDEQGRETPLSKAMNAEPPATAAEVPYAKRWRCVKKNQSGAQCQNSKEVYPDDSLSHVCKGCCNFGPDVPTEGEEERTIPFKLVRRSPESRAKYWEDKYAQAKTVTTELREVIAVAKKYVDSFDGRTVGGRTQDFLREFKLVYEVHGVGKKAGTQ